MIESACRHRQRMGGAMRQNGILAAAALHGLDHHFECLLEDHHNARLFADCIADAAPVMIDLTSVQTNIVVFHLPEGTRIDAPALSAMARNQGVLINAFGPSALRAVTHLDVSANERRRAADVLVALLSQPKH